MAVWFDYGVLMQDALHPLDPTYTDSHFMAAAPRFAQWAKQWK